MPEAAPSQRPIEPALSLPPEVLAHVERRCATASVILEYGAGIATRLAARLPGKFIQCVEAEFDQALMLRSDLDAEENETVSPVAVHTAEIDLGTGRRPADWQVQRRYPFDIWEQPFFRHPDLIVLHGPLKPACFVACCVRIAHPVQLLFDEYVDSPRFHEVVPFAKPVASYGRMAEFELTPSTHGTQDVTRALSHFLQSDYA